MRGAATLLYSVPRRGCRKQEVATLSNRAGVCLGPGSSLSPTNVGKESNIDLRRKDKKRILAADEVHPASSSNPCPSTVLLLEGDEIFLSSSGISTTYYELECSDQEGKPQHIHPFSIEERHDMKGAKKTFVLHSSASELGSEDNLDAIHSGGKFMGPCHFELELQEIKHGVYGSAGTGSTTWEASIAMSLFWSTHPELLKGDVIELGSGVGLGGILSSLIGKMSVDGSMTSMTLTDCNQNVLERCSGNVVQFYGAISSQPQLRLPLTIAHLDWYDFLSEATTSYGHREMYDTVIASDCAYRYDDVVALAHAMKSLLRKNERSRVHFFGPCNRGALHDLIRVLQGNELLDLDTEYIDLTRYRLVPDNSTPKKNAQFLKLYGNNTSMLATRSTSKFLHVTAKIKTFNQPAGVLMQNTMGEID